MAFADLLPDRFDVVEVVEDVTDGRLTSTEATVATGQHGRLVWRKPADQVYDEAGTLIVEADLLTSYPLELGHALDLGGVRWRVSADPIARRGAGPAVRHYSAPVVRA